jgi:glycerate kinase
LTSVEVARALEAGWRRARPDDEIELAPLADGGEGTLAAIEAAGGWSRESAAVHDPIGRDITADWLARDRSNGGRDDRSAVASDGAAGGIQGPAPDAVVELAAASGLSRLRRDELAPLTATTYGTGELIRAAVTHGATTVILGIGGSATNDGGAGILRALSGKWMDEDPDFAALDPDLRNVDLRIACDVTNPLLGPSGAAATYGPQKGATPDQVRELDGRLAAWAETVIRATGRDERETAGAGAAGGTGFAMLSIRDAFRSVELVPGVELVMAAVGFERALAQSDLVLTGEGRIDAQTAFGKTALGVARRANEAGVRCIAVGGSVEPEGAQALEHVRAAAMPVHETPIPVEEAMAAGAEPVAACAERIARAIVKSEAATIRR